MEGLSSRKRNVYFGALTLIFLVAAPAVALYATGYRVSSDFEIIKTGGIHVDVPTSGAAFYLDDEFAGNGTLFQRSFFTQNLTPGSYTVRIEKDGYHTWRKHLDVFPTVLTEAQALLLPEEVELVEVPDMLADETAPAANPQYLHLLDMFSATSAGVAAAPIGATTTIQYNHASTTVYERGGIGLWLDGEGLHARWLRDADEYPYVFCTYMECDPDLLVWSNSGDIHHFDFMPGNPLFVLLERPEGIAAVELDTREPQNAQPIYSSGGAQFRVIDGVLYILDGAELFEANL